MAIVTRGLAERLPGGIGTGVESLWISVGRRLYWLVPSG
jgi:hypothetical protein